MSDEDLQGEETLEPTEATVTVLPVLTPPGGRLRAARESRGLGLGQVVEALRVEQRLVEAMEANRFGDFDAPVYARGFLRKYAQYLGLSPEEMIAELDALAGGPTVPTHVPLTTAAPRVRDWSRVNAAVGILAAVVLVLGSFWWWHDRGAPHESAAVPAIPAASPPAPVAGPAAPAVPDASPAPVETQPLPAVEAAEGGQALPDAGAPAGGEGMAEPAPAAPVARATTRLELDFHGDSWTEVYGADGGRKVYGMLHAGDHRSLVGSGPWRLIIGKADRVGVTLDGREIVAGPAHRKGDTAIYHVDAHGKIY